MKLATLMGALSSYRSHSSFPSSVSISALSGPLPASPAVASSSENLPCSGSSGLTGGAGFGGGAVGGAGGVGGGGVAAGDALSGSAGFSTERDSGSAGVD